MVEKWNYEYESRIMVKSGNTSRIMGNLFIQEQRECYECLKMSVIFADNV